MPVFTNLKESKQTSKPLGARASCPHLFCARNMPVFPGGQKARAGKIRISLMIVLLTLAVSVFTGCGGDSGSGDGDNNNNNQQPPSQSYSVSFITNGGSSVMARNVQQGGSISAAPDTTREGYIFDGWYTDNNTFANRVNFPYTPTGNITLYAKWTAETTWIEIWTPADLNDVRNNLSGEYGLMADISLSSFSNWVPIGTEAAPFTGKINGNGYKITGLRIYDTSAIYAGLFGFVRGGEITRFALENVDVFGRDFVGAIAGYVENSEITGSYSTGKIESASSLSVSNGLNSGGIAGYVADSIISNSYSESNISSSATAYGVSTFSGGIAGRVVKSTIINSYSTGNAASSTDSTSSGATASYSGGIAGYVDNVTITGSWSEGNIAASAKIVISYSGGIAGRVLSGTIIDSYSKGYVTSSANGSSYSGGIAGYADGSGRITSSYSMGDTTSSTSSSVNSSSYSGGITGYVSGSITITASYNTGNVASSSSQTIAYSGGITGYAAGNIVITDCGSTENITSSALHTSYSGGVAGYATGSILITACSSTGNITSSARYLSYTGGVAGYFSGGIIRDSYNRGDVTSFSSSITTMTGSNLASSGGIVGYAEGSSTIRESYNTGNIVSSTATTSVPYSSSGGIAGYIGGSSTIRNCAAINGRINASNYAGRIAGYSTGAAVSVSNNFASNNMTATGIAFDSSGHNGVGKSDAQLRDRSTYENAVNGDGNGGLGWRFGSDETNPWKMPSSGYPILYWQ